MAQKQLKKLKLGTRRSALAWAQSSWVAREVMKNNPGLVVELVGMETQGDRIVDIPLRQVEGKEFFTAEIDRALLNGDVQFTVHSLKDLSLERPKGLRMAAIPKRANPRDVILFGSNVLTKLKDGKPLTIGTSAPRRLENLPGFLQDALPYGHTAKLNWAEIRGNVDTRLKRLREPSTSGRYLDGVVLSLAGLTRLWQDHEEFSSGHKKLLELLEGLKWMVLPLSTCPSAPGQGALCIECRVDDPETLQALQTIHHEASFEQVEAERKVLAEYGGGCHQRFGATQFEVPECGSILSIRGRASDGKNLDEARWSGASNLSAVSGEIISWDGTTQKLFNYESANVGIQKLKEGDAVFVAHARALEGSESLLSSGARVWTSGETSWFKLASKGIWVEGCSEGLGFEAMLPLLEEPVLGLPSLNHWNILTHEDAIEGWSESKALATYKLKAKPGIQKASQAKATHYFWNSGSQFDLMSAQVDSKASHACGPGKTAAHLKKLGIQRLTVFPSVKEWRKWLKIQNME